MALVNDQYCPACCAEKPHTNGRCNDCENRKYREEMAAWMSKTIDEKIVDIHRRVKRLEAGPPRY